MQLTTNKSGRLLGLDHLAFSYFDSAIIFERYNNKQIIFQEVFAYDKTTIKWTLRCFSPKSTFICTPLFYL